MKMTPPLLLLAAALLLVPPLPAAGGEKTLTAREVLDHIDDLFRGTSSYGTFSMKVVTEHYTREMKMEAWSKGKDHSPRRILRRGKKNGRRR